MKNDFLLTDTKVNEMFGSIVGRRFTDTDDIQKWIKTFLDVELQDLVVSENHDLDTPEGGDDYMNGTFGEGQCGRTYADFTLFYIKTNANQFYITEACWSY